MKQEDAFALDEVNLFQRLGLDTFIKLSTKFYTRVYDDDQEWFRKIFANSTKEDAIRNQYEFFCSAYGRAPFVLATERASRFDWTTWPFHGQ